MYVVLLPLLCDTTLGGVDNDTADVESEYKCDNLGELFPKFEVDGILLKLGSNWDNLFRLDVLWGLFPPEVCLDISEKESFNLEVPFISGDDIVEVDDIIAFETGDKGDELDIISLIDLSMVCEILGTILGKAFRFKPEVSNCNRL